MDQVASPDKPAYVCYLIVIVVGLVVAYGKINRLMSSSVGRWAFLETWFVFLAYAIVPVLLFWILDYTNAIHDTALFAALLVAIGYRQILSGEMKGTPVPGQLSALWSPFEAWATQIRDRIVTKNKVRSDRFAENLRVTLSQTAQTVADLTELAYFVATDSAKLTADLSKISQQQVPAGVTPQVFENIQARQKVDRCMMSIRLANPEDYGFLLLQKKLINPIQYWQWIGDASTRVAQIVGVAIIFAVLLATAFWFFKPNHFLQYELGRFQKSNATERDRFRTHDFLATKIANASSEKETFAIMEPLLHVLRYRDLDRRVGEDTLALILEYRGHKLNQFTVPELIEALHTENPDIRLRVHETLQAMRTLGYEASPQDEELAKWVPSKSDSPADIESKIKRYRAWWAEVPP
jgi:hypothetical protein